MVQSSETIMALNKSKYYKIVTNYHAIFRYPTHLRMLHAQNVMLFMPKDICIIGPILDDRLKGTFLKP